MEILRFAENDTDKGAAMDRKLAGRCIASIFLVNIGFAILLSGCYSYSALHQGQVVDGHSTALALRPLHREFVYGWWESYQASDTRATLAFRRGRAPSKKGETGYSIGILADLGISPEVSKADPDEIYDDFPVLLRGSYYHQLPKNSLLDAGIGGELLSES